MGTLITVAGADFSANPVGFITPVTGSLGWWYLTGGSAAKVKKNLTLGGTDATIVGSPTYNAGYTSFPGANAAYLQTAVVDRTDVTYLAVVRGPNATYVSSATTAPVMGTVNLSGGAAIAGSGVVLFTTGGITTSAPVPLGPSRWAGGSVTPTGSATNLATAWHFLAVTFKTAVGVTFDNMTDGTHATSARADGITTGANSVMIGALPDTASYKGPVDIAFAAVYPTLTLANITTIYSAVKTRMALFSITV